MLTQNNLIQCFQNCKLDMLIDPMAFHITKFCNLLKSKLSNNETVNEVVVFCLLALDIVMDVLLGEGGRRACFAPNTLVKCPYFSVASMLSALGTP